MVSAIRASTAHANNYTGMYYKYVYTHCTRSAAPSDASPALVFCVSSPPSSFPSTLLSKPQNKTNAKTIHVGDPNVPRTLDGATALHMAVCSADRKAGDNPLPVVQMLLDANGDPNRACQDDGYVYTSRTEHYPTGMFFFIANPTAPGRVQHTRPRNMDPQHSIGVLSRSR